jgi:acetyl esterase/lipase
VLGGHDASDPLVSPLFGPVEGFPPLQLLVAGGELLRDDTTRLAHKCREAGVFVKEDVVPNVFHIYR